MSVLWRGDGYLFDAERGLALCVHLVRLVAVARVVVRRLAVHSLLSDGAARAATLLWAALAAASAKAETVAEAERALRGHARGAEGGVVVLAVLPRREHCDDDAAATDKPKANKHNDPADHAGARLEDRACLALGRSYRFQGRGSSHVVVMLNFGLAMRRGRR
eukprot:694322-Pleurochrysis_carterae.AAC.1